MTNVIEEEISISLRWGSTLQESFHILNKSSTICNLKEKIYEIYSYWVDCQRILGRYPIGTELREMRNDEVIVNRGEYLLMTSVRGGAKTKLDLNDPHREIMNTIHNRIPEWTVVWEFHLRFFMF